MIYLSLLSCSDLKIGVGLKGAIVDDEKMTLDGDTFDIRERIGDSLLIVWNYTNSDDRTPYYLLKYERNGFYYPLIGASNITVSLKPDFENQISAEIRLPKALDEGLLTPFQYLCISDNTDLTDDELMQGNKYVATKITARLCNNERVSLKVR